MAKASNLDTVCKAGGLPSDLLFHVTGMPWAATNSPRLKALLDAGGATAVALKKELFGIAGSAAPDVDILTILENKGISQTVGYDQSKGLSVSGWQVSLTADNPSGSSFDGAGAFTPSGIIGVTWQPARTTAGAKYSVLAADFKTSQPSSPPTGVIYWPTEKDFGLKDWLDDNWNGSSYDDNCDLWVSSMAFRPTGSVGTTADGSKYSVAGYSGLFNTPIEDVSCVREGQNIFVTNYPQGIAGMTANLFGVELAPDGTLNDSNTVPYLLMTGKVKPGSTDSGDGTWRINVGGFTEQLQIKTAADRFRGHLKGYQFNSNDTDGLYNTGVGESKIHRPHMIVVEYNITTDTITTDDVDLADGGDGYVDFDTLDEVMNAAAVALNASATLNCSYDVVDDDIKFESPDTDEYTVLMSGIIPFVCGIGYMEKNNLSQLMNTVFTPWSSSLFAPIGDNGTYYDSLGISLQQVGSGLKPISNWSSVYLQPVSDDTELVWWGGYVENALRNRCTCAYFYQYDLAQVSSPDHIKDPVLTLRDDIARPTPENDSGERGFHYTNTSYLELQQGQTISFGPAISDTYFIKCEINSAATPGYFTVVGNEVTSMPWAFYWPDGLQDALINDDEYQTKLLEILTSGGDSGIEPSMNFSYIAKNVGNTPFHAVRTPSGLDDIASNYNMNDPFELIENSASFSDSPVTILRDLLGDPSVDQILPDSIRDTSIKNLFDRSDYNPRVDSVYGYGIIDFQSLQRIIDDSGLDDSKYALIVSADSGTGGRIEIPIIDLLQGVCLTHGAKMVWEWSEEKRMFHMTFISEGGQSIAEATTSARVVPQGGLVDGSRVEGISGGDWYFARVVGHFKTQDTSEINIGTENEDARLRHTLKDKTLEFNDRMTFLPYDFTGALAALKDRFSAYLQRWSNIQYKHKASVKIENLCRLPVGGSVVFDELPFRDMTVGKHNNGEILTDINKLTVNISEGYCNVEFTVDPLQRLGIGPCFLFDTFTRVDTVVEVSGLNTIDTGNSFTDPNGTLTDAALFDCWDYNKATGEVEARDCSCDNYAITVFEVGVAQNYSGGVNRNMWRGTIEVDAADLAGGTCTIGLEVSTNFPASSDGTIYAVIFSHRADANIQPCQTSLYGWLGNSKGIVTDSAAVEHSAITVGV